MITLRQHVPGFADAEPTTTFAKSTEELLNTDLCRRYVLDGFHRFSVSEHGSFRLLMVEHNQGKEWWVVGYLSGDRVDLPEWEPKK